MKHKLFFILIAPLMMSCGTAENSNTKDFKTPTDSEQVVVDQVEEDDDQSVTNYIRSAKIIIIDRIELVYDKQLTDKEIMSAQFYSVFHRAQEQSHDETGWPDWDYWRCTQGDDPEMSITDVEIYEGNRAMVKIDLTFEYVITQVELPMVYENDNWFVDDIISYEDGDTYSLKEAAKSLIN